MPSSFTGPSYYIWLCGSNGYDSGPYNYEYNQPNVDWGTSSNPSYPSCPVSEPHFTQSNPST